MRYTARMREEVEIVDAYLRDLDEAHARFSEGIRAPLARHRRAVRAEVMSLARHVLPDGEELQRQYDAIDQEIAAAESATTATGDAEDRLAAALSRERVLLTEDVLPRLVGTLDDVELVAWVRSFSAVT